MNSYLKVEHDFDQLGAVRWGQTAPLVEDGLQLSTGHFIKVQLDKAVPESPGQHLGSNRDYPIFFFTLLIYKYIITGRP